MEHTQPRVLKRTATHARSALCRRCWLCDPLLLLLLHNAAALLRCPEPAGVCRTRLSPHARAAIPAAAAIPASDPSRLTAPYTEGEKITNKTKEDDAQKQKHNVN